MVMRPERRRAWSLLGHDNQRPRAFKHGRFSDLDPNTCRHDEPRIGSTTGEVDESAARAEQRGSECPTVGDRSQGASETRVDPIREVLDPRRDDGRVREPETFDDEFEEGEAPTPTLDESELELGDRRGDHDAWQSPSRPEIVRIDVPRLNRPNSPKRVQDVARSYPRAVAGSHHPELDPWVS